MVQTLLVVPGSNVPDALSYAEMLLWKMRIHGNFQYTSLLEDASTVLEVDSPAAQKLIRDAVDKNFEFYRDALNSARNILSIFSDRELFTLELEDEKAIVDSLGKSNYSGLLKSSFFVFRCLAWAWGHPFAIYDWRGYPLRRIKRVEEYNRELKSKGLKLFVVQATVT